MIFAGSHGCLKQSDVTNVVETVNGAAVAVVDTAEAVGETAHIVVGTGAGVVIEILGGESNGRTCPSADLTRNERWIESLDSNLRMKDLVLPSIHHHGLVEGQCRYGGPIPGGKVLDWAVTQSLSVIDQLNTGARFLDIRLTKSNGRIYTAHGTDEKTITLGVAFDDLLAANVRFLENNNGEFLVWTFLWEFGEADWSAVEVKMNQYKDEYFYTGENPLEQPLSTLAGKIIICREGEENLLAYRTLDCSGSWPVTRDKDPTILVENIIEYAKHPTDDFNYIEAVATIDAEGVIESLNTFSTSADNLKDLACAVNKKVKESFLTEENRNLSVNFQSVMLDYSVHHQVISAILDLNEYKSNGMRN
jgi:hypothetical protein